MLQVLAVSAMIAALAQPMTAHRTAADDPPPTRDTSISITAHSGSGCPSPVPEGHSSVSAKLTADNSSFFLTFEGYVALVGAGASAVNARRSCQVIVSVTPPRGYSYSIAAHDYRSLLYLAAGASATYRATAVAQGQAGPAPQPQTVNGPSTETVSIPFTVDQAAPVWSPCGRAISYTVATEVRMNIGTSDVRQASIAEIDRAGDFTLRWQRCAA